MRLNFTLGWISLLFAAGAIAEPVETSPASTDPNAVVKLAVFPADVNLSTARDRQSLVVQATLGNGLTVDVTEAAKITLANPELVRFEAGVLRPAADGTTTAKIEYSGQALEIPIAVQGATADRPISFKLDVMPVFMKSGCNAGGCHGAARGKDGFRLSLFGFDADGDHYRLTREMPGRRLNLAIPDESLLLEKACGKVPHTGGQLLNETDEQYQTLLRWIQAGAPADAADIAKPVGIELYPAQAVLDGPGAKQRLTVRAKYSDGTDRDVTSLTYFMSTNDRAAAVDSVGVITAGERGEAFILARFETFAVTTQMIVLPKSLEFAFPQVPEHNYIDELVHAKLKKLRIAPSELCDDETFLRRVYLDIVGLTPSVEEYHRFMENNSPTKREELIDELLSRKEFVEIWVMKFAELLQMRTTQTVSYKSVLLYYTWLQEKFNANMPMDQMVQELLASKGGTFKNAATNFYQLETDALKLTENVAQVFMGMRIQCAQCHNHPFDRWTMDDYYSFAAFFSQIGRKRTDDPREIVVFNSGGGEVNHPTTRQAMKPKFLGGEVPDLAGRDRREVLAHWLASPENPYFATNLANLVWAHFFGKGIVDPVDDVRVSNPASNPELLQELGRRFTEYRYDFKKLVRDICTSRTYQLSTRTNPTNEGDLTNFSRAYVRRIRAEVLLDVVSGVTDTKNKFAGLPLGARAVQIADGQRSTYFLTTFGRASRETACSCEVKMEPTLSQALHLMNGSTVQEKIKSGGLIAKRIKENKTPAEIIEELYVLAYSRKPSREELLNLAAIVQEAKEPAQALEDVFWGLLNSREFLFSH